MSGGPTKGVLVFAPNWLGDAVMALPSLAAIRRQFPSAMLAVAARSHLAPLFEMVEGMDAVVPLERAGRLGGLLGAQRDARLLRGRFDVAILLPNSFRAAWIAHRAQIPERWGYGTDRRSRLLTRAVPRTPGGHQVEYYLRLLDGLGIARIGQSEIEPGHTIREKPNRVTFLEVRIPADAREWARRTLTASGWKPGDTLIGMAPGAAYGTAKQWPADRFARLAAGFTEAAVVLVGSAGDRAACDEVERLVSQTPDPGRRTPDLVINLAGATDLKQLAAIIAECRCFVSNDSGAMHLAAALGVPVVAIFGSTREQETAPLGADVLLVGRGARNDAAALTGSAPAAGASPLPSAARTNQVVLTTDVSCRPCMLRDCPLEEHVCMTGIDVGDVKAQVLRLLGTVP